MKGIFVFLVLLFAALFAIVKFGETDSADESDSSSPSSGGSAAVAPQPSKVATTPRPNLQEQMVPIAAQAQVTLVDFAKQGSSGTVVVEWSSDNTTQGMNFIQGLLNAGLIRDFDMEGVRSVQRMGPDGRRIFRLTCPVMFY